MGSDTATITHRPEICSFSEDPLSCREWMDILNEEMLSKSRIPESTSFDARGSELKVAENNFSSDKNSDRSDISSGGKKFCNSFDLKPEISSACNEWLTLASARPVFFSENEVEPITEPSFSELASLYAAVTVGAGRVAINSLLYYIANTLSFGTSSLIIESDAIDMFYQEPLAA